MLHNPVSAIFCLTKGQTSVNWVTTEKWEFDVWENKFVTEVEGVFGGFYLV